MIEPHRKGCPTAPLVASHPEAETVYTVISFWSGFLRSFTYMLFAACIGYRRPKHSCILGRWVVYVLLEPHDIMRLICIHCISGFVLKIGQLNMPAVCHDLLHTNRQPAHTKRNTAQRHATNRACKTWSPPCSTAPCAVP